MLYEVYAEQVYVFDAGSDTRNKAGESMCLLFTNQYKPPVFTIYWMPRPVGSRVSLSCKSRRRRGAKPGDAPPQDQRRYRSRPFKLADIARGFSSCGISFGSLHCEADTFSQATSICQRKQSLKITGMTWIGRYFVSIYSS